MTAQFLTILFAFVFGGIISWFITSEFRKEENSKLHDKLDEKDIANNKLKKYATEQAEKVFELNSRNKVLEKQLAQMANGYAMLYDKVEQSEKEYSELQELSNEQVEKVIELGKNSFNQMMSDIRNN